MRIVLYDADSSALSLLEGQVKKICKELHLSADVEVYCDSRKLLQDVRKYDLAILNTKMDFMKIPECIVKLRESNARISIILISENDTL